MRSEPIWSGGPWAYFLILEVSFVWKLWALLVVNGRQLLELVAPVEVVVALGLAEPVVVDVVGV